MLCIWTSSPDQSILSSSVRDFFSQSISGLASFSQGSLSMMFSFLQLMTKKWTFCVILPIQKNRGPTKRIFPLAFTESSVFQRLQWFPSIMRLGVFSEDMSCVFPN